MKKALIALQIILIISFSNITAKTLQKQAIPRDFPPHLRNVNIENVTVRSLAKPVSTGDTTFMVRADLSETQNVTMEEVAFYHKYSDDLINVYVEVAEYDSGRVTDASVDSIVDRMVNRTPNGSINPNKGIYANEIDIVGSPPDVDNNGKLNVLLIDVRDNYDPGTSTSYVAGYFDPLDQMRGKGNLAEIIYIDTYPADLSSNYVHTIVAHELQHLIHYNYDKTEVSWLNEGMSVLIPKVLGFPGRSFGQFISKPNNKLNEFDNSLEDYAKVGLWTYYIYNRFGINFISSVIKSNRKSLDSYQKVLRSKTDLSSIRAVMRDWFIANLINDPSINDGIYSYQGNPIPEIRTDHFSSSFTNGQYEDFVLNSSAAQYIQFYQGKDIFFEMNHDIENNFNMAVIKHKEQPEITFYDMETGTFELSDSSFGYDYDRISFIPYWASISDFQDEMNISYMSTGIGATREVDLVHDGDSVSFYITLGGVEAAEKFQIPENATSVSSIQFNMYENSDATVKIYKDKDAEPIKVFEEVSAPGLNWKRINLDENLLQGAESFLVSVTSDAALGYSSTGNSEGKAFLKNDPNGNFQPLNQFELQDGTTLDGNWLIRASVNISSPATMALSNKSIHFKHNENDTTIKITNEGTETLFWEIDTTAGFDWLSFSKVSGRLSYGSEVININIDRDKLNPGLKEAVIPIKSNILNDSIAISVLERNTEKPQAVVMIDSTRFDDNDDILTLKLFNIGIGRSDFAFTKSHPALSFSPPSGIIPVNQKGQSDTVNVNVFVNHTFINQQDLTFNFFDGVDTVSRQFHFTGKVSDTTKTEYAFKLHDPFPNPLSKTEHNATNIRFVLPESGKGQLSIFNIIGQKIRTYSLDNFSAGDNIVQWDGKNDRGTFVSSGVYFVRLNFGSKVKTKKLLMLIK